MQLLRSQNSSIVLPDCEQLHVLESGGNREALILPSPAFEGPQAGDSVVVGVEAIQSPFQMRFPVFLPIGGFSGLNNNICLYDDILLKITSIMSYYRILLLFLLLIS